MKTYKAIVALVLLAGINLLAGLVVCRWDMTDDQRYSISQPTKALLHDLDAPLTITLLLEGELNAGFLRLKKATQEMVDELGVYADIEQKNESGLAIQRELTPTVIHERTHKGKTAQTTVYPYAIIQYKGRTHVVTLLKTNAD